MKYFRRVQQFILSSRLSLHLKKHPVNTAFHCIYCGVTKLGVALIIVGVIFSAVFSSFDVRAATYIWQQTSWGGGQDSGNYPVHSTDRTGWTTYSAKDTGITADAQGVTLGLIASSTVQNTATYFDAGTMSSTARGGSGNSADVELSSTGGGTIGTWSSSLATLPLAAGAGASMSYPGSGDFLYVLRGGSTQTQYRYSVTGNSWSTLANVPPSVTNGGAYVSTNDDSLYTIPAQSGNSFYKYSISGNSWLQRASTLTTTSAGDSLVYPGGDFIYAFASNGSSVSPFYKYSISGNAWTRLATIGTVAAGAALAYPGSGDYIYAFRGGGLQEFYKYSITNDTWTQVANPPGGVGSGGSLIYPGSGDYIYALGANSTASFWKYSVSGNSWTTLTSAPLTISNGGTQLSYAGNYIYMIGGGSTTFSRYLFKSTYNTSGTFISSSIDLGQNSLPTTFTYSSSTPTNTSLKFQIRSASTLAGLSSATFYGPTGTGDFYTSSGQTINSIHAGNRYFQYKAFLSTTDSSVTPSFSSATINFNYYAPSASLTSSAFNSEDAANVLAKISWTGTTPSGTAIKFQIRTAPDAAGVPGTYSAFMGPDGTSNTYFTDGTGNDALPSALTDATNDEWVQYKVFLTTDDSSATPPALTAVELTYVANASPDFKPDYPTTGGTGAGASQNVDGTVSINYSVRDSDTTSGTITPGFLAPSFEYSLDNGSTWHAIATSTLAAGDDSAKAVEEVNYTDYTATWDAKTAIPDTYSTQVKIRVTVNDGEAANNTTQAVTAAISVDTKAPVFGTVPLSVDASESPAVLTLDATDDNSLQMKVGTSADLSGSSYETYSTSKTLTISGDNIYAQFKDAYGNESQIVSVALPSTPAGLYAQDISNANTSEWRVFFAWNVISAPTPGFTRYNIYRSTGGGSYSLLTTITNRLLNYIVDTGLTESTSYSYKVTAVDANGNVSFYSAAASVSPDGNSGGTPVAPVVSSVASADVSTTASTITWTTDVLSNSTIYYVATSTYPGTDAINYEASAGTPSMVTSHSVTLSHLSPNTQYYFMVKSSDASDVSGVSNSSSYTFTTSAGPVISSVSSSGVTDTSAVVTWTTSTAADSSVLSSANSDLSSPTTFGSSTLGTSHQVTLTGLMPGSHYYYYPQSIDNAGNRVTDKNIVNATPTYYSFTTDAARVTATTTTIIETVYLGGGGGVTDNRDLTKPVLSNIKIDQINSNSAAISFTSSKVTNDMAQYGTTTDYGSETGSEEIYKTSHRVVIAGLESNTLYHFRLKALDVYKNVGLSDDMTFTTTKSSGTTEKPLTSEVVNDIPLSTEELAVTEKVKTASYTFAEKILEALSKNSNLANVSESALTTLVSNLATKFISSPTISGNDITVETGPKAAKIEWTTDKDSNSLVAYAKAAEFNSDSANPYTITAGAPDDSTIAHKIELANLEPDTTYHYQLRSQAAIGPSSFSGDRTFTTASLLPEIKQVQFDDIGENSIKLNWKTDVPAKTSIEIKNTQTGKIITEDEPGYVKDHNYSIDNLDYSTAYTVKLIAIDNDKNTSTATIVPFSTVLSKKAPTISNVRITTSLIPDKENTAQTIISWKTDKPSTSQVLFTIGANDDFKQSTPTDGALVRDHVVITTLLSADTVYKIVAESNDSSGNVARSDPYTVLTPSQKGSVVDIIFNNFGKTFGFLKK